MFGSRLHITLTGNVLTLALLLCGGTLTNACAPAEEEDSTGKSDESATVDEDEPSDDDEDTSDDDKAPSKDAGSSSRDSGRGNGGSSGGGNDAGKDAGTKSPASGSSSSLWCEAQAVFKETCGSCHGAKVAAGAPMPLVEHEDFMANAPLTEGKKAWEVAKERIHDKERPMPPTDPLKGEQLAAVDAWFEAGAPEADGPCDKAAGGEDPEATAPWPPEGTDECFEFTANGSGATVQPGTEPHPQFVFDAPWGDAKVQATGFRPITDNTTILHHWILYGNGAGGGFINGWAPGKDDSVRKPLPPDVGVQIPSGPSSLRLDVHYYNREGTKAEVDASGVEVCITRTPRKNAATTYMGFVGLPNIPAGAKDFDVVGTCNVSISQPVFLLTESPHAHELATWMKFYVKRGEEMIMLHDAPFAFDAQLSTPLPEPFELKNGDQVITTCTYTNDTSRTVTFGENTGNEMCFNFASYYPAGALSCSGGGLGGIFGGGGGGAGGFDISTIFGGGT